MPSMPASSQRKQSSADDGGTTRNLILAATLPIGCLLICMYGLGFQIARVEPHLAHTTVTTTRTEPPVIDTRSQITALSAPTPSDVSGPIGDELREARDPEVHVLEPRASKSRERRSVHETRIAIRRFMVPAEPHRFFGLMDETADGLQAILQDSGSDPLVRARALTALLERKPAASRARGKLRVILGRLDANAHAAARPYTDRFNPMDFFSAQSQQSNVKVHSHIPPLHAVDDFMSEREAASLISMAQNIWKKLPPPLLCFDSEQHMQAVLASAGVSAYEYSKKDFLPQSNCLAAQKSADLLGPDDGSGGQLGAVPRSLNVFDDESPLLDQIAGRIQDKFGLLNQNAGPFQVLWYPAGSAYTAPSDCKDGRWANVLISLNDDMEGGATLFPKIPIAFRQKTGRALAWVNVNRSNGECDKRSAHAGKPVVTGEKFLLQRVYGYEPPQTYYRSEPPDMRGRVPFQPNVRCDVRLVKGKLTHACRLNPTWEADVHVLKGQGSLPAPQLSAKITAAVENIGKLGKDVWIQEDAPGDDVAQEEPKDLEDVVSTYENEKHIAEKVGPASHRLTDKVGDTRRGGSSSGADKKIEQAPFNWAALDPATAWPGASRPVRRLKWALGVEAQVIEENEPVVIQGMPGASEAIKNVAPSVLLKREEFQSLRFVTSQGDEPGEAIHYVSPNMAADIFQERYGPVKGGNFREASLRDFYEGTGAAMISGAGEVVNQLESAAEIPRLFCPEAPDAIGTDSSSCTFVYWIATPRASFQCHFDFMYNFYLQLEGRKALLMFPPADAEKLSLFPGIYPEETGSSIDFRNPDFMRHPNASQAQAIWAELGPGDVLFLPAYWFHHTWVPGDQPAAAFSTWRYPSAGDIDQEVNGIMLDMLKMGGQHEAGRFREDAARLFVERLGTAIQDFFRHFGTSFQESLMARFAVVPQLRSSFHTKVPSAVRCAVPRGLLPLDRKFQMMANKVTEKLGTLDMPIASLLAHHWVAKMLFDAADHDWEQVVPLLRSLIVGCPVLA